MPFWIVCLALAGLFLVTGLVSGIVTAYGWALGCLFVSAIDVFGECRWNYQRKREAETGNFKYDYEVYERLPRHWWQFWKTMDL